MELMSTLADESGVLFTALYENSRGFPNSEENRLLAVRYDELVHLPMSEPNIARAMQLIGELIELLKKLIGEEGNNIELLKTLIGHLILVLSAWGKIEVQADIKESNFDELYRELKKLQTES